jgi:hypothetical protein
MNATELNQIRHYAAVGLIPRCRRFLPETAIIENEVASEHVSNKYTAVVDLWWSQDNQKYVTSVYTSDFIEYSLETKLLVPGSDEGKMIHEQSGQFVEIINVSPK